MKKPIYLSYSIAIFALYLLVFPKNAYAYLDAGTASYVLQLLVAALVGASIMVKIYWGAIKAFFGNIFSKKKN